MKTSYYKLLWMLEKKIVPKKVKYYDMIFEWSSDNYKRWDDFDEVHFLSSYLTMDEMLKDEIEILDDEDEEKKIPEKIEYYDDRIAWIIDDVGQLSDVDKVIIDKLNDVLDYLEKQRKGE